MVDTYSIKEFQHEADALLPPGIAVLFHGVPIVEGVAPKLTVLTEIVGRNARNTCGKVLLIQLKQTLICPHVCTIVRHVDGNIANNLDTSGVCIRLELRPLAAKFVLGELPGF